MTVGELIDNLANFPRDWEITFGVQEFNRLKMRGEKLVDMELWPLVARSIERDEFYTVPEKPSDIR
jgi:hypothetical protein